MRIFVDTLSLNAALSTVIKALPIRTTVSILEGIYMKAAGGRLLLRCTDLNIQIETLIDATIEEEGAIVLPGRLFSEMVKRLPGEMTSLDVKKNTAEIISGSFKTTLQGENAADYHAMSDVNQDSVISLKPGALKEMVKGCIFAAAQDDSKPILTGALLELKEGEATLIALDGYRLALRRIALEGGKRVNANLVVPARSLLEVSRILPDGEEAVSIGFSKTHLVADAGNTRITARLMEGEFIKYRQILPESHTTRVRVNRKELLDGIERVALMAREGKSNLIKFTISTNKIAITANSEIGRSNEEMEVNLIGEELEIAFNSKYFSDVLKVLEDEEIYLDMNNNISPCVVRPIQGEMYYYLILPVRLFTGM